MTRVMTKSTRKTISLLLTVMLLFSMCSVGLPAAAYEYDTLPLIRMATPTDASPTDASPTNASPTDASPTDASPTNASPTDASPTDASPTNASPTDATPTDATPTDPDEQQEVEIPMYYYKDSRNIEILPTEYINGIMIAHYFNIMGAYDAQNNFKPDNLAYSSDIEHALKAIDSNEPTMTNFAGELMTVQALVHRIWLAAGKGSYIYSTATQQSYLGTYDLDVSYNDNNDLANAWTFCVKNGIIKQFLGREDFSKNLPVTRAMAAYALSNYYLWRKGYNLNKLSLNISGIAPIDEFEMKKDATATDAQGNKCHIKQAYIIGEYEENDNEKYDEILVNIDDEFVIYTVDLDEYIFSIGAVLISLPDWVRISHNPMPVKRTSKSTDNQPSVIYFDLDGDGEFDDYTATVIKIKSQIQAGDLNETGELDSADCLIIQKYLTGSITLDSAKLKLADINEDGEVNLLDAYTVWAEVNCSAATPTDATPTNATPTNPTPERSATKTAAFNLSALAYIRRVEAENTQNTTTTFKFMSDGEEILSPLTLNANTHYLKLPQNTYEKENYSFNYFSLYRLDENGNKLYHCTAATSTDAAPTDAPATDTDAQAASTAPVMWLAEPTGIYKKTVFVDESFIYNIPTGEFSTLYFEENRINYNDFKYTVLGNGTAEITIYKGNDTYVTLPKEIDGYTVTSIGYGAFEYCSLKSITIPDSVTSIGDWAFSGCTSLTSVTFSENSKLQTIGNYAFYGCTSLTSITIPNSVTSIGDGAFEYCTSLTSITIPDSVTSIEQRAFEGCTSLASITIPNSVTSIGSNAFYKCPNLTISCYENSYAHTYAIKNDISYTLITETP